MDGLQTLLVALTPCSQGSTSTTCNSAFDTVAVFVFPNVKASTSSDATTCPTSTPASMAYSTPTVGATTYAPSTSSSTTPSYLLTGSSSNAGGYLNDYSSTNSAGGALATTSQLGILTGADTASRCGGLTTPISGQGTYLAGAIYAAQASLVAAQTANPGSQNAMVILTDGDANASTPFTTSTGASETALLAANAASGLYPSMYDQCQQAITAAKYASTNGTTVYPVAYGAATTGCNTAPYTDTAAYRNPCANLQAMATAAADFYSDATTANKGACTSTANPNLTLDQVFQSVAGQFTKARLIPN